MEQYEIVVATKILASAPPGARSNQQIPMAKKPISHIGEEIHQSKPFATTEEELLVSLCAQPTCWRSASTA